ncbi:MAG: AAA family ATPase [Bacteroidia bacterium]
MKLKVTNLGVLGNAEIDLSKRINLFFGENGTGKTYISYLVYAVASMNGSFPIRDVELVENGFSFKVSEDQLESARKYLCEMVLDDLPIIFGIGKNRNNSLFKNTRLEILAPKNFYQDFVSKAGEIPFDLGLFSGLARKKPDSSILTILQESFTEKESGWTLGTVSRFAAKEILKKLATSPITTSTIFPVERNSVYTFSKELSVRRNEILDELQGLSMTKGNAREFTRLGERTTRYPKPIRDALRVAEDLENISKSNSFLFDLAVSMERELLGGGVKTSKDGQVEFVSLRAPKLSLSIHQSSSIVKTLASLIIYLKHRATREDLVIIDEPELNLHPKAQILLTRYIVRMAKAGLRFIISTHSDYIVREFNNLMMLHSKKEDHEQRKIGIELGYAETDVDGLDPIDVGALYFSFPSEDEEKAIATAIPVDEFGVEVSSFDETITALNRVSDELYYAKKYGKVHS